MFIGIDNGISGGIAVLSDLPNLPPIAMIPMPTYERRRKPKGKDKKPKVEEELDCKQFILFLQSTCHIANSPDNVFFVEQCPRHAASANAMRVMAFTYGKIIAILETVFPNCPVRRVRCGNDNDGWQKALLPDAKAGETKQAALALVKELWPEETWLASARCSTPNYGMIDAALIAYFGRKTYKPAEAVESL